MVLPKRVEGIMKVGNLVKHRHKEWWGIVLEIDTLHHAVHIQWTDGKSSWQSAWRFEVVA